MRRAALPLDDAEALLLDVAVGIVSVESALRYLAGRGEPRENETEAGD